MSIFNTLMNNSMGHILIFIFIVDICIGIYYFTLHTNETLNDSAPVEQPTIKPKVPTKKSWEQGPAIDDSKVTAKSSTINGYYIKAGAWSQCSPEGKQSREVSCIKESDLKSVSLNYCKDSIGQIEKTRKCNYDPDCIPNGKVVIYVKPVKTITILIIVIKVLVVIKKK